MVTNVTRGQPLYIGQIHVIQYLQLHTCQPSRETKSGKGVGSGGFAPPQKCFFQKDAKWCTMLHFGYTICSVKSLNINVV